MSRNKERRRGIQAYFTKFHVAYALAYLIDIRTHYLESVLDPAGGVGNLLEGFQRIFSKRKPALNMVEPCQPYDNDKPFSSLRNKIGFFNMSFEEWCLTYAERKYDLVFANPPFGERLGKSQLGEDLCQMFLPEVVRFESLFFLASSKVAFKNMAFIVPNGYFNHSEALPVMNFLASTGWNLLDIRSLPLDACSHAKENMMFLLFGREQVSDWPKVAVDQILRGQVQTLVVDPEIGTFPARHGVKTGYLLPKNLSASQYAHMVDHRTKFVAEGPFKSNDCQCFPFEWKPSPKPLGAVWNRQGLFYELGEFGWSLANGHGYADGVPVNNAFAIAKQAFKLNQKGAIHSAYALVDKLDLEALRREYRDISSASFLMLLRKGPVLSNPLVRDLENLGILAGEFPCPDHPDVEKMGGYLVHKRTLSNAHACHLFLECENIPQWIEDKVEEAIRDQYIPTDKVNLRSPWIPRDLIASYLGWKLDEDGLYISRNKELRRYLNYGDSSYIKDTDSEEFQIESEKFAIAMNDHESDEYVEIRKRVHAHYLIQTTPKRIVQEALNIVPSAFPLHAWQRDDLDFYLSGSTISNLDVGLGKTLTALQAAVVHSASGAKTLITVPKQVLSKWLQTLETFFPTVEGRVLGFIENSKGTMVRLSRKKLTEQARALFFDPSVQVILTSHQVFGEFQVQPQDRLQADLMNAEDQLGGGTNRTLVKKRAIFMKQAGQRTYRNGGEITFSDLPQGLLVVIDEAHNFKGLFGMPSSGWGEALIMAGQCGQSKRAYDMQVKLDSVRARGGKTLALTATVVNNSVAEIFNMLRIFAPQVLEDANIRNTQQLMDYFCIIDSVTSVSLTGKIKHGQTIKGFKNIKTLQDMWGRCMITRTAQEVGLPLPVANETIVRIDPCLEIGAFMDKWKDMLMKVIRKGSLETEKSDGKEGEKEQVGILRIISMLDKVAAFPPSCGIQSNPKFDNLTANVIRHYNEHDGQQIVFVDEKEVQEALAKRLVDEGIPRNEIKILNATTAPNIAQRLEIAEAFNKGEYRVAIGGKMISEGIDLQENTVAAHFLNLAWEGGTIHQRKGRLVRQGNKNKEVFIYYYLLSGSTDDYRFLTISNKAHWGQSLRQTQCETLEEGIFSNPVDDELLCSLAKDPIAMKSILIEKRNASEQLEQLFKAERLFKKLLDFASPKNRLQALEILQKYESTLRSLDCIPSEIVDEGVYRVQVMAHLHYNHNKHQPVWDWENWILDNKHFCKVKTCFKPPKDPFELGLSEGEIYFRVPSIGDYLDLEKIGTLPSFPFTFGQVLARKNEPRIAELVKGPALDLIVIDPAGRHSEPPKVDMNLKSKVLGAAKVDKVKPKFSPFRQQREFQLSLFKPERFTNPSPPTMEIKPWPKASVQLSLFD